MKLLVDMNLSPLWVPFFMSHGIAAKHWSTLGSPLAPDSEIFEYAVAHGLVVFTHDLDFGRLLAVRGSAAPSVIQIRTLDVLPSSPCGQLVLRSLRAAADQLEEGALVTVDVNRQRIRLLPI